MHPYVEKIIQAIQGHESNEKRIAIIKQNLDLIKTANTQTKPSAESKEKSEVIELEEALIKIMAKILDSSKTNETDLDIMDILIDAGANPNQTYCSPYTDDYTPLMIASMKGREKSVEFLIRKGAEIDARTSPCPKSALIFAIRNEKAGLKIAELLLNAGANPTQGYGFFEDGLMQTSSAPKLAYRTDSKMLDLLCSFHIKRETKRMVGEGNGQSQASAQGIFAQSKIDSLKEEFHKHAAGKTGYAPRYCYGSDSD